MPTTTTAQSSSVSTLTERRNLFLYDEIIKQPNGSPLFLSLHHSQSHIAVYDIVTNRHIELPHRGANAVVRIDALCFATASATSVKFWRFSDLTAINEWMVINSFPPFWKRYSPPVAQCMKLLPDTLHVIGLTSSKRRFPYPTIIWVTNIATGVSECFDLTDFLKTRTEYRIEVIPNTNKFILYGRRIFILELDLSKKTLVVSACFKDPLILSTVSRNIVVSPNGTYWACDMRGYGLKIFKNTEGKIELLYDIPGARLPIWNETTLFYTLEGAIYNFIPEDLHRQVTNTSSDAVDVISPCFEPNSFRVKKGGSWETCCWEPTVIENYVASFTKKMKETTSLLEVLINLVGEFLNLQSVSLYQPRSLTFFKSGKYLEPEKSELVISSWRDNSLKPF